MTAKVTRIGKTTPEQTDPSYLRSLCIRLGGLRSPRVAMTWYHSLQDSRALDKIIVAVSHTQSSRTTLAKWLAGFPTCFSGSPS